MLVGEEPKLNTHIKLIVCGVRMVVNQETANTIGVVSGESIIVNVNSAQKFHNSKQFGMCGDSVRSYGTTSRAHQSKQFSSVQFTPPQQAVQDVWRFGQELWHNEQSHSSIGHEVSTSSTTVRVREYVSYDTVVVRGNDLSKIGADTIQTIGQGFRMCISKGRVCVCV